METQIKQLTEISSENMAAAARLIIDMVSCRKLTINGEIPTTPPVDFGSKTKKKQFSRTLGKVLSGPTIRSANTYLHALAKLTVTTKIKVDYSDYEKSIQLAKANWKAANKAALELKSKYLEAKGDFYKR
jgi:hypothetical protein